MIKTVGDVLEALRLEEAKRLDAEDISHAPTIGAMYEGLTKDILGRAIPPGLDLRVVSGFAVDGNGARTGQLDCMLVRGEGRAVPYVDGLYQWHVRDVLAVFEVKKKLFGADLGEAYGQLQSVAAITSSWLQNASGDGALELEPSLHAYSLCTGEVAPPPDQWAAMDPAKHLILHAIIFDQIAPVRIVLGYFGYGTESGLRRGFDGFLEDNLNAQGFGPISLPNLIVASGASLVKTTGHPYNAGMTNDGYWNVLGSSHVNPTVLILEAIWTRISYLHSISNLFGEDLQIEVMSPFLAARPVVEVAESERIGWMYRLTSISAKDLAAGPDHIEWEPVFLDAEQSVVITNLLQGDVVTTDPDLLAYLASKGRDPAAFFQSLYDTHLVALDGTRLVLIASACELVVLPDARFAAAENNTGRLTRWMGREIERHLKASPGG